jgi:hypothetical protein
LLPAYSNTPKLIYVDQGMQSIISSLSMIITFHI